MRNTRMYSTLNAASLSVIGTIGLLAAAPMSAAQTRGPVDVTINIDASAELRQFSPRRLGGTNVALWNEVAHFKSPLLRQWIEDLRPGYIRIPGGSWSNAVYWNGNGVRDENGKVDPTKIGPDGYPAVDYSAYRPGFSASNSRAPSTGYHGNVDVKTLSDWITTIPGVESMPCLNAGTGRPVDAAEWVRWANHTNPQYKATIWEIGNELDGSWEPGHYLPDGSSITAEDYVRRYNGIASAMREIDPKIKIGGCAFVKPMIQFGGTNVDFASIHTYPGSTANTPQENLANLPKTIEREVSRVRGWIREFQPAREKDIEIAYTEWNLSGGLNASDLFSGLWHSLALAEMARNGVDFATQWDVFTHSRGMTSGHALIFSDGDTFTRKAGYYAMWMWNNFTGDRLLKSDVIVSSAPDQPADKEASPAIYSLTTRDDNAVYVMLINPDSDRQATVSLNVTGADVGTRGEMVSLTSREYFWNPLVSLPQWSARPQVQGIDVGSSFKVILAPFSSTHVRVPLKGKPESAGIANEPLPAVEGIKPELRIVMPSEIYAGDRVTAWVQACMPGTDQPFPVPVADATLESTEGTFDRPAARLAESLGQFTVTAKTPGDITISARSGDSVVMRTVKAKLSEPRPMILWDFRDTPVSDKKAFRSDFALRGDESVRANKEVARVDLPPEGVIPSEEKKQRALLVLSGFPGKDKLDRANIRGVAFDVMARDIASDDPNASVQVVMQSPANWWMVLGSVPLKDLQKWKSHQVLITNPKHIEAIGASYNVWFVLSASKPVRGTVFFDRVGLMVR
jgi:hypothetical protein